MMKNLIKYIAIFAIVFSFTSCDEESNFKESDISLTSVYTLTEITGTNAAFKINIYKQKNILTEYSSVDKLKSYETSGFVDSSTDTNYEVTVNKLDDGVSSSYVLSGDKLTGTGTLTVDGVTVFNVVIAEDQIYN
ncbi:hypothetical protein [Polaribacter sp. Z022]|uniref:hypothetical protein n=1 Tax=Polaribacter sp. Z022 TaxID=2927125 RepID=UPI00202182E1|nr:hypothetical protein [Polaribacter sp. Z022]MCL7752663.1 hypothetical protein [Polaribacter sp. Z022]